MMTNFAVIALVVIKYQVSEMFCPKCSQQQASEEMRFCSRCGFPLAGVAILLETDGVIPRDEGPAHIPKRRGKIIKESLILTLASWIVALFSTLFWDVGGQQESVAKVASLVFFILGLVGLLRFLYAFLFVRERSSDAEPDQALPVTPRRAALPPQQEIPLTDYPRRVNTKEMSPRVSVTENTTRLLAEEPRDVDQ